MKDVRWVGDSREQLRRFPKPVRGAVGEALRIAQIGGKHRNAKPLIGVGSGVFEIVARYVTMSVCFQEKDANATQESCLHCNRREFRHRARHRT